MPSPSRSASRSSTRGRPTGLLLGGALGALATAILGRGRRRSAEARLLAEASEREAERSLLAAQLVTAEQDERRRLALILHDGPLQSLSGIALMLDAALAALEQGRADEAKQVIESAVEREREVIQTLRDLSFAIEPVILRDRGFAAAVRALAGQIEQARRIGVTLDVGAGERLGDKAQVALYQTIREALYQAVRRRPKEISLGIEAHLDGGISVAIADNGVEERRRESLEAIRERARILGGTVSMEPGSDGGTVVLLVVPPYVAAAGR